MKPGHSQSPDPIQGNSQGADIRMRNGSSPVTMREFRLVGMVMTLLFCAVGYLFTTHIGRATPEGSLSTSISERVDQSVFRAVERQLKSMDQSVEKKYPVVKSLPRSKRRRIMVTGGAGFVGSHLVDRLMEQGHEVIVVDNLFTGAKRNIEQWLGHPNFEFHIHDVTEPLLMEVDRIYHLACPASPPHYQYNPVKTIKTSVQGTLNLLGLAKRVKARMLFTSTSEVYGDPEVHPQPETYWGHVNPIGPRACYDEGKRVAETMMYAYKEQDGVDVRVARIFNTFGPRMNPSDGRVVSNFIVQALQGHDITIYGDGSATRSFQYVDDLVAGLMALMEGDYDKPVNIGNPEEYTIGQFAKLIHHTTHSNSTIKNLAATADDPKQRKPDITVARTKIGWQPRVTVEDGLKHTIAYFAQELRENGEIASTGPGQFAAVTKRREE